MHERLIGEDDGPEVSLQHVVIKSDSEYVVKGMTSWIHNWKLNGYRNSKKKPVVNTDLFKDLEEEITALNNRDVHVQFWHVPREQNKIADYLANCILDGITAKEATERIADDDE
jgi:ribonuclease HI